MATTSSSLRFLTLIAISLICIPKTAATTDFEMLFTASPPLQQPTTTTTTTELHEQAFFSQTTALLSPILSHLGFNELATAAPSISTDSTGWSGPSTLFAPSDSSIRTCYSCSVPSLLREHLVPGLFNVDYLRKLPFGTKIDTLSPGRCITVTSTKSQNDTVSKVFIGGVEITHPDLFNNGLIIIHGMQGYIYPLSPLSCDVEQTTSLSFPFQPSDRSDHHHHHHHRIHNQQSIMRLMLRDAMLRLRSNGFNILSLAFRVKYSELVTLNNMTVFALDDVSIFSGSFAYISNIRFHIVPNHYLTIGDLERFPVETTLPSLEPGRSLMVTTSPGGRGGGDPPAPLRINHVRVKVPDVMKNLKIIVHSVYLPFPHIHATAFEGTIGVTSASDGGSDFGDSMMEGECTAMEEHALGPCGSTGTGSGIGMAPPVVKFSKPNPTVEIEDHHTL